MAVKKFAGASRRRVMPSGPRRLKDAAGGMSAAPARMKYAGGGLVERVSRGVVERVARAAGHGPAKRIEAADKAMAPADGDRVTRKDLSKPLSGERIERKVDEIEKGG
jgi:hypothetical protein